MGGYVALCHASKHPSVIDSIITLATKFDWTIEGAQREAGQLNIELMKSKIPEFVEVLKSRHGNHWEDMVHNTKELMLQLGQTKPLNDSTLKVINTKTLVCIGDKDKMVGQSESEHSATLLANGTLHILQDTPHPFEQVSIDLLTKIILDFARS